MRFLSPEWIDSFNDHLSGFEVDLSSDDQSLSTQAGPIHLLQVIAGSPEGDLHIMLTIGSTGIRMEIVSHDAAISTADSIKEDVAVKMNWADAVAMSTGKLTVTQALAGGMIKVRGNLSVLIDSQRILDAVGDKLASLHELTTYG
ncbi:MAG: SCP2 sterol-binding domain-containing protein [Actinobacteria bacterium]|jgi:putative sterol carrier protein|nr:SCP2 sterol-binding domain-containing protein [Actinomycetota bacterium]